MWKPTFPPALRRACAAFGVLVLLASLVALFYYSRRYVDLKVATNPTPPAIQLKDRPAWMSDALADSIARSVRPHVATSALDHRVLVDITNTLRKNPWVKQVKQVSRLYTATPGDTISVQADYRVPVALVRWGNDYWLIDSEGFKLPEKYAPQDLVRVVFTPDRRTNLRIIQGVRAEPPKSPGQLWPGDDLQAGIALVKLLTDQPFAHEIIKIDATNFAGRRDPRESQLVLVTRYNTEIRWGRPLDAKDFFAEVSPARKLDSLARIQQQFGRVDAKVAWVDVRFDKITYPTPDLDSARADTH